MIKASFPKGLPHFKINNKTVAQILNDMADAAVNQIFNDTQAGRDIDGNNFQRLRASTARAKRRKGQTVKPLVATGMMSKVFRSEKASATSLVSEVDVSQHRKEIAEFHIEGEGNLPKRVFFGVGDTLKPKLQKIINLRIEKIVKTMWKKK